MNDNDATQKEELPSCQASDSSTDPRFRAEVTETKINEMERISVPENTRKKQNWSYSLHQRWSEARQKEVTLMGLDKSTVAGNLTRFIMEVRKSDGSEYPGKTLYEIVTAIQGYLREHKESVLFFSKDDASFKGLRCVLNGLMRQRAPDGINIYSLLRLRQAVYNK